MPRMQICFVHALGQRLALNLSRMLTGFPAHRSESLLHDIAVGKRRYRSRLS
jgi:hypothetical protein